MMQNITKMPSSRSIWFILATMALLIPGGATAETRMIDDFGSADWLNSWSFAPGGEFPGARGALIADKGYFGGGASLKFDFSCSEVIGPCDPRYVDARRKFDTPIPGEAVSLWVRCDACEPVFKITDSTGQLLTYGPVALPLAAPSLDAWHRLVLNLRTDIVTHRGGANDGIFHPGIKEIRVSARKDGILPRTGTLQFDQLRLHDSPGEAYSQEISLTFPTGSFRAPNETAKTSNLLAGVKSNRGALTAASGFSFMRVDLKWGNLEKTPGVYNWTKFDAVVQDAEANDVGTMFVLGLGHPIYTGYTGGDWAPPRSADEIDAFLRYVKAAAEHFKGKRVAFEVWNEPNCSRFWAPVPSVGEYAALLRRTITATRSVNPDASIITAGLCHYGDPKWQYLSDLLRSGAVAGADFIGIHSYTGNNRTGEPEGLWRHVLRGRHVVEELMPEPLPFWNTEWGFSSTLLDAANDGHSATSRHVQAVMIARELLVWKLEGMPQNFLFYLSDGCEDPANYECNFGLLTTAMEKKPAMIAVEAMDAQLQSRKLTGILKQKVDLPSWLNVARFQGADDQVLVAWISSPKMEIRIRMPEQSTARDMYGQLIMSEDNVFTLKYSDGPIYVTIPGRA